MSPYLHQAALQTQLTTSLSSRIEADMILGSAAKTIYDTAAIILSLRKVNPNYRGNAIRVRRSSDNALNDIGFSSGALDEATLVSFLSGSDGFVHTVYDQGPGGFNASNSVNAEQPRIATAGTVVKDGLANNRASLDFENAQRLYTSSSIFGGASTSNYAAYAVCKPDDATFSVCYYTDQTAGGSGTELGLFMLSSNAYMEGPAGANRLILGISNPTAFNLYETISSSTLSVHEINKNNGAQSLSNSTYSTYAVSTRGLVIGDNTTSGAGLSFDGKISEIQIFNREMITAYRDKVKSECNSFYGIY